MTAPHGRALRDVAGVPSADRETVATFVGSTLRSLHDTQVKDGDYISFGLYEDLIGTRMSRAHRDRRSSTRTDRPVGRQWPRRMMALARRTS